MRGVDHIASTLKRCCSNTRGILRIVNILEDFKNASPQNTRCFNYSLYQVIKYNKVFLEMVKLTKLKNLKKFMSCLTAFAPSPIPSLSLRPQHYGIPLSKPFSWVGTLLAHTAKTTSGTKGIMETHPEVSASTRLQ